ncbi:WxL domain-containing protein [Enterococcus sp. MJM16]|uniref:WxL domain-containing protein n=1 Tax=Candidatus Enterococcus murrayae TaxID=2815321 RepID=A0ABS3HMT2_9ENTE|nr:WxL domain-containing protein [Enterococcus sp. MJM16]MBO0454185.1 WxL domain-containing protein [Enterococcus sp. MJM16]
MLLSIFIGGTVARADDTDTHMKYQSGGGTSIKPLDPMLPDPAKPVIPVDPTNPTGPPAGTGGSLSIDFASGFQFGNQAISTKNQTYYAIPQEYTDFDGVKKKGPNYVQVTDIRGTGSGWQVSVKQNGQFQTAEAQTLEGAELQFKNGEMISNLSTTFAPNASGTVQMPLDTEIDVVTANSERGIGTWLYRFGSDESSGGRSVQLTVPGSSVKYAKKYQTSLTWSLKNVP